MMELLLGLVGTVESGLCFPSRCGNPRCVRISISGDSFHRPAVSFFFAPFFFLPFPGFPQKNFAPGTSRNDDRQFRRPTAYPLSSSLLRIPLIESKSPLASGSPMLDADVRDCKKQNTFSDWLPFPARPDSPSDKPLRTLPSATSVR